MTLNTSISELRDLGLLNVNYPDDLRESVERAIVSWKAFCQLPKEEKCAFSFLEDNRRA